MATADAAIKQRP